jgi:hypothetical protein
LLRSGDADEDDRCVGRTGVPMLAWHVIPTTTELLALLRSGDADEEDRCVGRTGVPM